MRLLRALAVALMLSGAVGACATSVENTPASIAREQAASRELLARMQAQDAIVEDRALNSYINGVVGRIAAERPRGAVPLRAYVVNAADANAFTTGGGYLFVNAGLLTAMENEAQFATVAAHEIAHIDRGHVPAGQANRQGVALAGLAARLGAAILGVGGRLTNAAIGLGQNASVSSFSRTQETDADATGFAYAAGAGFNMVEGARSFEVLNRVYGSQTGLAAEFFSSHPQSAERQANLTRLARRSGSPRGRIGAEAHDAATRRIRRDILGLLEREGRDREAAQIRRNLRS